MRKDRAAAAKDIAHEARFHQACGEAIVFGRMLARHLMRHCNEIVGCLLWSDAGPERTEDKQAVVEALDEEVVPLELLLVDDGCPELGPEEELGAIEAGGRDSDDGEGVLVQVDDGADDARIGVEARAPKVIAEHDVGRGVGPVLIVLVKDAAQRGLHAEQVEVVARDLVEHVLLRGSACAQARKADAIGGHACEGGIARFEVEVIRVGLAVISLHRFCTTWHEPVRIGDVERAQQDGVEHAEDDDVSRDAEGQCDDRRERESRRAADAANDVACIARQRFQMQCGRRRRRRVRAWRCDCRSEGERREGFSGRHAGGAVVVGAQGDVRLELVFDVAIELRATEEIGDAAEKMT